MRPDFDDLTGRTMGARRVTAFLGVRRTPGGQQQTWYGWQCARCGSRGESPRTVLTREPGRCPECSRVAPGSVRVAGGQTTAGLARMAGLKPDTVYKRHRRGWQRWELAVAPLARGERRGRR